MDEAFEQLFHPGTIVFGVCLTLMTFFFRKLVETSVPSVKKKSDENVMAITYETTFARYWNQVILYAMPSVFGAIVGIFEIPYLYGTEGPQTMAGRIFTGIFVGGTSAFCYKAAKKRWGIDLEEGLRQSSTPPAADP